MSNYWKQIAAGFAILMLDLSSVRSPDLLINRLFVSMEESKKFTFGSLVDAL